MTFLAIDIGNTRLKWAQYSAPRPGAALLKHGAVFLETIDSLAEKDWRTLAAPGSMLGCVVAGEGVKRRVQEQLELWDLEPRWVVSSARACGVVNSYDHPSRLGVDRWVALIGARHRVLAQGAARPVLVVMVGTAVTVDALDAHGRFLGGPPLSAPLVRRVRKPGGLSPVHPPGPEAGSAQTRSSTES